MTPEQALDLAHDRPSSCDDDLYDWAVDAENALRLMAERLMVAEELAAQYAAKNDALRADAARYRHLSTEFRVMSLDMGGNHVWVQARSAALRGATFDAAVDAAMERAAIQEAEWQRKSDELDSRKP